MFAAISSLGLGGASVILIGKGETSLRRMVSAILVPVGISAALAGVVLTFVARTQ